MELAEYAKVYQDRAAQVRASLDALRAGNFETPEELHGLLRRFVLNKYLLPPDVTEESLNQLAAMSVERTMELYGAAGRPDHAATCEGTTSAMNKKVLLLMAIQKELDIRFDPAETAEMKTTRAISRVVFRMLKQGVREHETQS